MDEAIEIEKKYRERRVQLDRPVQYGGNSSITEKTVISRPGVHTWKVPCEREEMTLANPALDVWLGGQRGQDTQTPEPPGSGNGKYQSERGGNPDRAVGSLGRLGYLTAPGNSAYCIRVAGLHNAPVHLGGRSPIYRRSAYNRRHI